MLDKYGVAPEEALEAAASTVRQYRSYSPCDDSRRYIVPRKTEEGRRLWVVYEYEPDGRGRIVTAREARGRQDAAHHRRLMGE